MAARMLIQAQPDYADRESLHVRRVKRLLVEDFRRAEAEVAISSGDLDEIAGKDLNLPTNRIRFVVTQQKLREGWDCPYAYVLCTLADQRSERAVEQLLGRILRLPLVRPHGRPDLNQAYAFATSADFTRTATSLRNGLVECGFDRIAAEAAVRAAPDLPGIGPDDLLFEVSGPLPRGVNAAALVEAVERAAGGAVRIDPGSQTIVVRGGVSETVRAAVAEALPQAARAALGAAVARARGSHLARRREAAEPLAVPQLMTVVDGVEEPFDSSHVLGTPWRLDEMPVAPVLARFAPGGAEAQRRPST